ncbi:MAG TPA: excinuclease ABC subunit UvrC [Candidatus Deferrimicrobiaceae bacterium]|nr:excinuclease ABC subunit UvrC [Candidatus Deferrimicrobiaceae bacterium]
MGPLSGWRSFPRGPGVYLMSDVRGKVLYVGKAKNLRSRLHQYAVGAGDGRPQIPHLLGRTASVRCIVTSTEKEALLLENTLIKEHRPPFNIFLRDDKEYLLLRIDRREAFPRPELVRRVARDGAMYFGPFSSARGIRETLRILFRLFPLCSCSRKKFASRTRPCLNHQMGRCVGACAGLISREAYLPIVDNAIRFLRGNYRDLLKLWKAEMTGLSREMKFEEAARLRDRIAVVENTLLRQRVVRTVPGDVDAVGWFLEGEEGTAAILHVREGRLSDVLSYHFRSAGEEGALASFLLQHYAEGVYFPGEILLPLEIPDSKPVASLLSERAGMRVVVRTPEKGERARLVELANRNAAEANRMRKEREADYERVSARLALLCRLPKPPVRVEGFDISNIAGAEPAGSMVTFVGGKAAKKWYRKFAVRGVTGQDDFAMMAEVVRRRFGHDEDFGGMPDLVLIDGGKGQLAAALGAMRAAGQGSVPVVSLAKERSRGGRTVFFERIFLPGRKNPVVLPPNDPVLLFLMRIRDEAHRFALSYHRARRAKTIVGRGRPPA